MTISTPTRCKITPTYLLVLVEVNKGLHLLRQVHGALHLSLALPELLQFRHALLALVLLHLGGHLQFTCVRAGKDSAA